VTFFGILLFDFVAVVLAQANPQWAELLTQTGIGATCLGWFMFRLEGKLIGMTNSNDRLARAQLVLVLSLKQSPDAAKEQAREGILEIDDVRKKKEP